VRKFTLPLVIILLIITCSSCATIKKFMDPYGESERTFTDTICKEYVASCELLKTKFAIRPTRNDTTLVDAFGYYIDSLQWYLIDRDIYTNGDKTRTPLLTPVLLLMNGDLNKPLYFYSDKVDVSNIIPKLGEVEIITTGPDEVKMCGENAVSIPPVRVRED
jgi:hypothetical protein